MAQGPVQCCYLSKVAALGEEAGDSGCGGVAGVRAGLAIKEWGGTHELSVKRNKESNHGAERGKAGHRIAGPLSTGGSSVTSVT